MTLEITYKEPEDKPIKEVTVTTYFAKMKITVSKSDFVLHGYGAFRLCNEDINDLIYALELIRDRGVV